jgi:hypothetical protein
MTTVTFGLRTADTFQSLEDTTISQSLPNSVGGSSDRFYISCVNVGTSKKGIIKIPSAALANIPSNAVVSAASLTITRLNNGSPARNYEVKRLLVDPNEAQATWNIRATATNWQVAGASGAADVDATILATGAISTSGGAVMSISNEAIRSLVQSWVNGTLPNYGVLLQVENDGVAGGADFDFGSGQRTTVAQRPYWTITYDLPIPPNASITSTTVNNLAGTVTQTVTLSSSFVSELVYQVQTESISATPGVDYVEHSETLTFAPGETVKTVTIQILP